MEENGDRETWDQWPEEHATRESAREWLESASGRRAGRFSSANQFFRYVQWVACDQWEAMKAYAEERGVALMGDIPFGVNLLQRGCLFAPGPFALDWSGGAPPEPYFKDDEFTQKWGQNWGIPLYRWDVMRARNLVGGAGASAACEKFFTSFGSITCSAFTGSMRFRGARRATRNFCPFPGMRCASGPVERFPQFYPRDDSTWENCEANRREGEEYLRVVSRNPGNARGGRRPGNGAPLCPAELAFAGHRRLQDSAMGKPSATAARSRAANTSGFRSRLMRPTITNRCGRSGRTRSSNRVRHRRQAAQDLAKIAEFAGIHRRQRSQITTAIFTRRSWRPFRSESWIASS